MICPNCNREVPDIAKACGYCGHWLAADDVGPTIEVADESGATVALPEEKGRSPWLWIGVGLVVVILIAAIAALVLLLGGGGQAETPSQAAATATPTAGADAAPATLAPVAAAPEAPAAIPLYDDFDDPALDGRYNQTQWRRDDPDIGHFVQEDAPGEVSQAILEFLTEAE